MFNVRRRISLILLVIATLVITLSYASGVVASSTTITIHNQVDGKTMEDVGFSGGFCYPDNNQHAWLKYSNTNAMRFFINIPLCIPESAVSGGGVANTLTEFNNKRNDLRANPEASVYIDWSLINFGDFIRPNGSYRLDVETTYDRLNALGMKPVADLILRDWQGSASDWDKNWVNWKYLYATVYHLAKNYDATDFQYVNEPEDVYAYCTMDDLVKSMQIYSDAIYSAIQDVNRDYNKNLTPKFYAPVLAGGSYSPIGISMMQNIRTDYAGNTTNYDLFDVFDKHQYTSNVGTFASAMDGMNNMMQANHPNGTTLPIAITEFNYNITHDWKYHTYTSDTPYVFTTEAYTWAELMNKGAYAGYLYRKDQINNRNGNHVAYRYSWDRDPDKNITKNKPVVASSSVPSYEPSKAVDGDIRTTSMWKTPSNSTGPQTLEIDLEAPTSIKYMAIDTGDLDNTGKSNIVNNYKIQYWSGSDWIDIPNGTANNYGANRLWRFLDPGIITSKVRFYTEETGEIRVREIYMSSEYPSEDYGGPMKVTEVTRLFATGFSGSRELYKTTFTNADNKLRSYTYTSYDPDSKNYYIWLPRKSTASLNGLQIDLSHLDVAQGNEVTRRLVDDGHFGEVTDIITIPSSKVITLDLPGQSVSLLTIPKTSNVQSRTTYTSVDDAYVKLGTDINTNYGSENTMEVKQNNDNDDDNQVTYIKYNIGETDPSEVSRAVLSVYGNAPNASEYRFVVYGILDDTWDESTITGNNAPNLKRSCTIVTNSGQTAFPVAHMTYNDTLKYVSADVTEFINEHEDQDISFVLVRERLHEHDYTTGQYSVLNAKEAGNSTQPKLDIWSHNNSTSTANIALGKEIILSGSPEKSPFNATDGDYNTHKYAGIDQPGLQWFQIDLEDNYDMNRIKIWRYYNDNRSYKDCIIQISNDENFQSGVETVYNNDTDNSAGFGAGTHEEYLETLEGKEIIFTPVSGRYVRFYSNGNSVNEHNHIVEIEVYKPSNIAMGKAVTLSGSPEKSSSNATDGDYNALKYAGISQTGLQWFQVDLEDSYSMNSIKIWRFYKDSRSYKDCIIQISDDENFQSGVETVYNNDTDNSAGFGSGTDGEYVETSEGKEITFPSVNGRYVRFYSNGNSVNTSNHIVEIEIY